MLFRAARRDKQIHVVVSPDLMIRSNDAHTAALAEHTKLPPLSQRALKPLERVRFSIHTHRRACIALASATLLAGGAMALVTGGLVRHGHASQPVMIDPTTLVHSHAAMKEARLVPQNEVDENRRIAKRIDIAEGTDDGEATLFTYQHVILDLKNEGSGRGLLDLASVRGKRRGRKPLISQMKFQRLPIKRCAAECKLCQASGYASQKAHELFSLHSRARRWVYSCRRRMFPLTMQHIWNRRLVEKTSFR